MLSLRNLTFAAIALLTAQAASFHSALAEDAAPASKDVSKASSSKPEFQGDGSIVIGTIKLRLLGNGQIQILGPGGSTAFFTSISLRKPVEGAGRIVEQKLEIDKDAKAAWMRSKFLFDPGKEPAPVSFGYKLLGDGSIQIVYDISSVKDLVNARLSMHNRRSLCVGRPLYVDAQLLDVVPLSAPEDKQVQLFSGSAKEISFILGLPAKFNMAIAGLSPVIMDSRMTNRDGGGLVRIESAVTAPEGTISMRVEDLAAASGKEVYAGVDYGVGGLKMPQRLAGNLVENPGFEQGLRCWDAMRNGGGAVRSVPESYRISESGAYEGKRCLEIALDSSSSSSAAPFSIPVEAGKPYTLSFYAKTDSPGVRMAIPTVHAFASGKWSPPFTLDGEWKRFSATFTSPSGMIIFGFAPPSGKPGTHIWIDAVQFEPGETASPFVSKPAALTLVSSGRGNLIEPGAPVKAALRIDGKPGLSGEIEYSATGFDGRPVQSGKEQFKLDSNGSARIELPWAEKLGQGLYILETSLKAAEGFSDRDWQRLAIMPSPPKSFKHSTLFCANTDGRRGDWDSLTAVFKRFGIGSDVVFAIPHGGFRQAAERNGILVYSMIYNNISSGGKKIDPVHDYASLTPEQLKDVEECCYNNAKANPGIRQWKTVNEPQVMPLIADAKKDSNMKAFIDLQRAAWRGVKRADPKMQVMTPDCSNMYPEAGIAFIDAWFAAGGGEVSDIVAIHPYRPRPEDPDIDAHTALFLKVLDKYGFKGEVWFTEGMYHQPWHIPAYNLTPHTGCSSDHFRGTAFSYHLARAERMCAAYTMRYWLAGLKYSSRVRNQVDWGFPYNSRTFDLDYTPSAMAYSSNTLACLLGNSAFIGDIELGAGVRCYLFEDGEKRPVAAIWSCDEARDLGTSSEADPELVLPSLPPGTEAISFDGIPEAAKTTLAATPWPRFLRAPAGSTEKLKAALNAGSFPKGGVAQARASLRLVAPDAAEAQLANLLGRTIKGRLIVKSGSATQHDASVSIAGKESFQVRVPVKVVPGEMTPADAVISFTPEGSASGFTQNVSFECGSIRKAQRPPQIDGKLDDWPAASKIAIPQRFIEYKPYGQEAVKAFPNPVAWKGAADLSASMRMAWDSANLYLALDLADDVHDPIDDTNKAWQGDSLQLYIDSWGDARERRSNGYGNDDQSFRIWTGADGAVRIIRDVAPERQISFLSTGPVAGAKSAFKRQDGHSIYEFAIPLKELEPMKLSEGSVIGLAILLNDRDNDYRKRALTMTAPGMEAHMHPERWPLWMLSK